MKKLSPFCLLSVFIFSSFSPATGQDYYPLPLKEGVWQEYFGSSAPNVVYNTTWLYYSEGDTFITPSLYKKIFREGVTTISASGWFDTIPHTKIYFGALREDTVLKKVYFFDADSLSEALVYNFDVNVGDTLHFLCEETTANALCSTLILVDSIGLISIDNSLRKQFFYHVDYVSGYPVVCSIIEGVGNTEGFIYSNFSTSGNGNTSRSITCLTVNGIKVYGIAPECYSPGYFSGVIDLPDQSISVNEFQNGGEIIFQLENPTNKIIYLTITDLFGRTVGSYRLDHSQDLSLSRSEFNAGYHLATFTSENAGPGSIKFVVF